MKNLNYKINFWTGYIGSAIIIAIGILSPILIPEYNQWNAWGLCLINIITIAGGLFFIYQAIFEDYEKAYGDKNATTIK